MGLGLDQSPTLKAVKEMKACDRIFVETYTSPIQGHGLSEIASELNVEPVSREFVEDGRKILELAKTKRVALVSSGDPLVATTHQELRCRALREGIETRIIHGSSILSAISGELGLHSYNFGRMVTMTEEPMQYTAYNTVYQNLLRGLHTTILLQWDESRNFFLLPRPAGASLQNAENDLKYGALKPESLVLVASRLGSRQVRLVATSFHELQTADMGEPPHTIVIPGKLHFTEREALGAIMQREPDSFTDNSASIEKAARMMIEKYSKKTIAALGRARKSANIEGKFGELFENVECYTQDSIRFLNEGKEELAVLSIGYAEGLLDSLRFAKLLDFEW